MIEVTTVIANETGIHARPASLFVQTASKFKSKIQLKAKGKVVDAKSILMLMSMGLVKGTEITLAADGSDEAEAVQTLKELVDNKFGENDNGISSAIETETRKVSDEYVREQAKKFNREIKRGNI